MYSSKEKYRSIQLDSLRAKVTEEERLNEIDRQIYNLNNLKQVRFILKTKIFVQLSLNLK